MIIVESSKQTEPQRNPARITFHVKSNKKTVVCTVHGWKPSVTPQQVVHATKDYVLGQVHRTIVLRGEKIERWWAEDEFGNVVDSHDEFTPPRKPRKRRS